MSEIMHRHLHLLLATFLMSMTALSADEITELQSRAKVGDAKAQIDLAIRLRDGKGMTKDDAEAMQWAHKAADAGNADALDFVGFAYLRGAVVKRNPADCHRLLQSSGG
jgi:TPR repeat protein